MNAFRIGVVSAVLAALINLQAASAESYRPKVGTYHPQIVLPTIEHDRVLALSSFRGKKVLLVHFASW